jgi:hypothetical protein
MRARTIERQQIIDTIHEALKGVDWARAAWLGGSDATERTDAWSDVDFVVMVEDDRIEEAFALAREALEPLSPIEHSYRLPSPTWHGHEQEFLALRDADPRHMIDLVVMKRSAEDRFLERERHGDALVLFDRDGVVKPATLDRAAHDEKMRRRLTEIRATFPIFQHLVTKAVDRGFPAEAVHWFQALTIRPLVEVLRMKHCPDRYDFGLRYLDRDVPPEVRRRLEELALPSSPAEIETNRARAETMFVECLEELDRAD